MNKKCRSCSEVKDLKEFYKDKANSDGHAHNCKRCKNARTAEWRNSNRRKYNADMRAYNKTHYHRLRLQRYKLTPDQYQQMLEAQKHACKLCGKKAAGKRPLAIDHHHDTGKVRGLLCYGCNRAIVILDNPKALKAAFEYIEDN